MKYTSTIGLIALTALASACGEHGPASRAHPEGTFAFSTGAFEIQSGDNFECFYTATTTAVPINVRAATGTQGAGGHHITVYYTDQKVPVGHHACQDVEMLGLHQIAAAGGGKEGIIALPDGYATKVPTGKQLVVQSHYIRTEPGPATVEDRIELQTIADADVTSFANAFVMVDGAFHLPARTTSASTTECSVPRDLDVLLLLGHMHERGAHYKLERLTEGAAPETLYETPWEPLFVSHPPVTHYEKPLKLAKGTRLRQTCEWTNTEATEMTFPREMCVMFSYYVPDDGFIQCDMEAVKR